jgi:hypothetical protein
MNLQTVSNKAFGNLVTAPVADFSEVISAEKIVSHWLIAERPFSQDGRDYLKNEEKPVK